MKFSMKAVNQLFFRGFIVVMPVTITLYLLYVLSVKVEGIFGDIIKTILGPQNYVPGLGIGLTVIVIFIAGILVSNFITGRIIQFFISKFEKVPLIKAIYGPLKDLMSLFSSGGHNQMKRVVMIHFKENDFKTIGLVTREEFDEFEKGVLEENRIAVYIPMSYMLGGFTCLVPREVVTPVDIPVDQAIKLAITGWIKAESSDNPLKSSLAERK